MPDSSAPIAPCEHDWMVHVIDRPEGGLVEYAVCNRCQSFNTRRYKLLSEEIRHDERIPKQPALKAKDWPEQGTNSYSIDAVAREGGKASTEVKQ